MTADDVKDMEEKQKLLMDKMAEFEQITKLIQSLIGLSDTPSSQLGLQPSRDGDKAGRPEENLPKVSAKICFEFSAISHAKNSTTFIAV